MMTTKTPTCFAIEDGRVAQALTEATDKLDATDGEIVFDFSSVETVDPGALRAVEALVSTAEEKGLKLFLRGVNIDVYKVLKLARLAERFSFVN
jgi:anti-anti-sigma regulatory factor